MLTASVLSASCPTTFATTPTSFSHPTIERCVWCTLSEPRSCKHPLGDTLFSSFSSSLPLPLSLFRSPALTVCLAVCLCLSLTSRSVFDSVCLCSCLCLSLSHSSMFSFEVRSLFLAAARASSQYQCHRHDWRQPEYFIHWFVLPVAPKSTGHVQLLFCHPTHTPHPQLPPFVSCLYLQLKHATYSCSPVRPLLYSSLFQNN